MKRFRFSNEEIEVDINLAHVLMSISQEGPYNRNTVIPINNNNNNHHSSSNSNSNSSDSFKILERPTTQQIQTSSSSNRMFGCKTCNRQFPSFQALGGHRASHKKPRMLADHCSEVRVGPTKPRVHGCPICGLKFTIGQALGGHMRRHRAIGDGLEQQEVLEEKKVEEENTTLCLDLNLAPPGTQWPKMSSLSTQNVVHKVSSMVDCFL